MHSPSANRLALAVILMAAGVLGYALWRSHESMNQQLAADAPLPMPATGLPDHRFHFLPPWQVLEVPKAVRFDPPLGSEHGGLVYNAQKFWEMNSKRGGYHTGDDLNGIGGMNTDLGDPVFSVADGLVIYTGEPSPGWGKLVVIAHTSPDGRPLQSMYAHLNQIDVAQGQIVGRGAKIGTVGTANGYYPAHLHFEMRTSDGVDIGAGYAMYPLNRLDPGATVSSLRNAAEEELSISVLGEILQPQ
jgi:murein DD-endopeptidase MepM/ murein hydrolase activator NlpD